MNTHDEFLRRLDRARLYEASGEADDICEEAAKIIRALIAENERIRAEAKVEEDLAYEIGTRDGYEDAIQDMDVMTGGDGEFVAVLGPDPDERHCPDVETMKKRIIERMEARNV